jgi:uncharacterized protein YukE
MAVPTKGVINDIHSNAERHRSTADSFRQDNRSVQGEVDGLTAINRGDLMTKLDQLQNEWSQSVTSVCGKLDEMANYLDTVANQLQQQDSDSGGGLN